MTKLEDIARRYYAAFNAHDLDAYRELLTPDCVLIAPGTELVGLEATRAFDRGWLDSFPHARIEVLRSNTTGNIVTCANWMNGGAQAKPLHTPNGDIPVAGGVLDAAFTSSFELEGQRIKRQVLMFDPAIVFAQLRAPK